MKTLCLLGIALIIFNCTNAQTDSVFSFVEQMPEFAGGDAALMSFIMKHLEAPSTADEWCGSFRIRFVIDTDGTVINPVMTKSCGPAWDTVLLGLVKKLPKFSPGYHNGKAVKVYFTLPVSCLKPSK